MNLLLVERQELASGTRLWLAGRRAEHLLKVLRVEAGRVLRAGMIGGGLGEATVLATASDRVEIEINVDDTPAARPAVDLIVALPRPPVLRRLLQIAATMGVGRIDLVNAWRVEKSFFASPALEPAAIHRQLLLGAEQGKTTWLPEVRIHPRMMAFWQQRTAPSLPTSSLLADPRAARPYEAVWRQNPTPLCEVAIGPEGGWIEREVATFSDRGFAAFSLGPWILRVDTAVVAVLSQLELIRRLAVSKF